MILSAFRIVERRWAITMVVRFSEAASKAAWTTASVFVSNAELPSSRIRTIRVSWLYFKGSKGFAYFSGLIQLL